MILTRNLLLVFGLLVGCLNGWAAPGEVAADTFDPAKAITLEVFLSHDAVAPGEEARVAVVYHVPPNYHITDKKYENFYLEADTTDALRLDAVRFPKGVTEHNEQVYRGDVVVSGTINVSANASGVQEWTLYAGYQVCSETGDLTCYMPVDKELKLEVPLVSSAAEMTAQHTEIFGNLSEQSSSEDASGLEGKLQNALESGSWMAFLLVFLGGVLSSLTPCVYPVIPITISFIGGRSKGKLHGFIQSLYFVLGMALVYSLLGMAAAIGGGSFGAIGQSSTVQIVVAILFLAFAASMFGAFEIQLPSSISSKMQQGDKSSPIGAVLMGAVTGFIAAPCVGPIILMLLVFIASTQSLVFGFFLMLAYALGMGLLFLVIGTFAGAMNALPGAGGWMDTVKKFFGVVMVAMAIYFLRVVIPEGWMPWLAGGGLVIFAVYSGAFQSLSEESGMSDKFYKSVGLIALVVGARFLFFGFGPVGLPGTMSGVVTQQQEELSWQVSSPENDIHAGLLAEAAAEGVPVMVDFWATWCVQCKELDHKTWTDPAVFAEGQRFRRIKMDMTQSESDWARNQNEDFSVLGMPTVIFYGSNGQELKRFVGFQKPDKVLAWMQEVH